MKALSHSWTIGSVLNSSSEKWVLLGWAQQLTKMLLEHAGTQSCWMAQHKPDHAVLVKGKNEPWMGKKKGTKSLKPQDDFVFSHYNKSTTTATGKNPEP